MVHHLSQNPERPNPIKLQHFKVMWWKIGKHIPLCMEILHCPHRKLKRNQNLLKRDHRSKVIPRCQLEIWLISKELFYYIFIRWKIHSWVPSALEFKMHLYLINSKFLLKKHKELSGEATSYLGRILYLELLTKRLVSIFYHNC